MARAAKRDKFHTEAQDVYELLEEVVDTHHEDLGNTVFLVLFKHGGWQSKGKHLFGKVQVLNDAFRRTMKKDAIMYLNADMWKQLSDPQRKGLLDHLLYGLDTATDRHDNVKEAADGRPLLTTRPHDFEGFVDVVKRHGPIMEDIKRLARALTETNQMTIDDVKPDQEPPKELREGIQGTINPDGTVVVEQADENQMAIDEVMQGVVDEQPSNVTNIGTKRQTKKEKEEAARLATEKESEETMPFADPQPTGTYDDSDDLPL
ncbi:MAG: hypothetical protein K0Q73_5435 [Paenibacillus sp.]|nr:hypothetical protein [Paenibacillus sp.]